MFSDSKYESTHIFDVYQTKVRSGKLKSDVHQIEIIKRFDQLNNRLRNYSPKMHGGNSVSRTRELLNFFNHPVSILHKNKINTRDDDTNRSEPIDLDLDGDPRGLYLHGDVGCGKTMLMDLFCDNCCVPEGTKRRIHFHSFMLEIHSRIHQYKIKNRSTSSSSGPALDFNPIPAIAQEIVSESWLLCLDELQVTDIGDAMIIRTFFKELFNRGIILITTSNRHPDDLYKNGLQRANFLPFIPLVKRYCTIIHLKSGIDYRRLLACSDSTDSSGKTHIKVYYITSNPQTTKHLDTLFSALASKETDTVRPRTLTIKARNIHFAKSCGQVLDSNFKELCDKPLGAEDYLILSQTFHTIIVRDIPQMDIKTRGQARRFITMIDAFYDNSVRVIFSADVPRDELFKGEGRNNETISDDDRKLMDDLGMANDSSSIFTGEEEKFAFYRTMSRITEMQSQKYWERCKR
ncbi:Lactation elevated protein 1 [Blomia tropicalis]|nr:Lactation elevated protein 1 [Blomia tropicalis]